MWGSVGWSSESIFNNVWYALYGIGSIVEKLKLWVIEQNCMPKIQLSVYMPIPNLAVLCFDVLFYPINYWNTYCES